MGVHSSQREISGNSRLQNVAGRIISLWVVSCTLVRVGKGLSEISQESRLCCYLLVEIAPLTHNALNSDIAFIFSVLLKIKIILLST